MSTLFCTEYREDSRSWSACSASGRESGHRLKFVEQQQLLSTTKGTSSTSAIDPSILRGTFDFFPCRSSRYNTWKGILECSY